MIKISLSYFAVYKSTDWVIIRGGHVVSLHLVQNLFAVSFFLFWIIQIRYIIFKEITSLLNEILLPYKHNREMSCFK